MNPKEEKKIIANIKAGIVDIDSLVEYYIRNSNIWELAQRCAYQALAEPQEETPIAISQEDYEKLMSMFRVKGQRMIDGNYVSETRGRKKGDTLKKTTLTGEN